jgi:hypothetical protein
LRNLKNSRDIGLPEVASMPINGSSRHRQEAQHATLVLFVMFFRLQKQNYDSFWNHLPLFDFFTGWRHVSNDNTAAATNMGNANNRAAKTGQPRSTSAVSPTSVGAQKTAVPAEREMQPQQLNTTGAANTLSSASSSPAGEVLSTLTKIVRPLISYAVLAGRPRGNTRG